MESSKKLRFCLSINSAETSSPEASCIGKINPYLGKPPTPAGVKNTALQNPFCLFT